MGRIIKALILGWIGKKVYDRTLGSDSGHEENPKHSAAHAKRAVGKQAAHKPARKAA